MRLDDGFAAGVRSKPRLYSFDGFAAGCEIQAEAILL
jgi:hypothetical protein